MKRRGMAGERAIVGPKPQHDGNRMGMEDGEEMGAADRDSER